MKFVTPILLIALLLIVSTKASAMELIRVRTDPTWTLIDNNVNAEFDFLWGETRTVSLGFYYSDGWDMRPDSARRLSPGLRVDFHGNDPRTSGWHPNLMVQTDLIDFGNDEYGANLRVKARQSYTWVADPLSITSGIGIQGRTGPRTSRMACYLCPAYEVSVGWAL